MKHMGKLYKIILSVCIILFITAIFVVANKDVISIMSKTLSFFNKNVKNINIPVAFNGQKEIQLPGKIDMPGALRITADELLNNNGHSPFGTDLIKCLLCLF